MGKKRIIKKYELLSPELLELIKKEYPEGFEDQLISFQAPNGELELALPLETDEAHYMIKMPKDNLPEEEEEDSPAETTENLENFESLEAADEIAEEEQD